MHYSQLIQFLHNSDSSSESSSDDETSSSSESDSFLCDVNIISAASKKTKRQFIETTVNKYTDAEFNSHFQMSKTLAKKLIHEIKGANVLPTHIFGRKKISPKKAFLMAVWYLVHQETFRQLSERWDVSFSSAHRIVTKIFDYFINSAKEHIYWPRDDRATISLHYFSGLVGIHGVIGAVGEFHVPIKAIKKSYDDYMNRDGYHSVLLQAVVDHEMLFTDVFCGKPGSLTEPTILTKSPLFTNASSNELFNDTVLIGDYGYPNLPWLVPPFSGDLSDDQVLFNAKHETARGVIDDAFGVLTSRFSRLLSFNNLSVEFIVKCITASCVLHNICIRNQEQLVELNQDMNVVESQTTLDGCESDKFELSDYFTECANEYEQRYCEKTDEKCRKEQRHLEKLELLRERRAVELDILNILQHSNT